MQKNVKITTVNVKSVLTNMNAQNQITEKETEDIEGGIMKIYKYKTFSGGYLEYTGIIFAKDKNEAKYLLMEAYPGLTKNCFEITLVKRNKENKSELIEF